MPTYDELLKVATGMTKSVVQKPKPFPARVNKAYNWDTPTASKKIKPRPTVMTTNAEGVDQTTKWNTRVHSNLQSSPEYAMMDATQAKRNQAVQNIANRNTFSGTTIAKAKTAQEEYGSDFDAAYNYFDHPSSPIASNPLVNLTGKLAVGTAKTLALTPFRIIENIAQTAQNVEGFADDPTNTNRLAAGIGTFGSAAMDAELMFGAPFKAPVAAGRNVVANNMGATANATFRGTPVNMAESLFGMKMPTLNNRVIPGLQAGPRLGLPGAQVAEAEVLAGSRSAAPVNAVPTASVESVNGWSPIASQHMEGNLHPSQLDNALKVDYYKEAAIQKAAGNRNYSVNDFLTSRKDVTQIHANQLENGKHVFTANPASDAANSLMSVPKKPVQVALPKVRLDGTPSPSGWSLKTVQPSETNARLQIKPLFLDNNKGLITKVNGDTGLISKNDITAWLADPSSGASKGEKAVLAKVLDSFPDNNIDFNDLRASVNQSIPAWQDLSQGEQSYLSYGYNSSDHVTKQELKSLKEDHTSRIDDLGVLENSSIQYDPDTAEWVIATPQGWTLQSAPDEATLQLHHQERILKVKQKIEDLKREIEHKSTLSLVSPKLRLFHSPDLAKGSAAHYRSSPIAHHRYYDDPATGTRRTMESQSDYFQQGTEGMKIAKDSVTRFTREIEAIKQNIQELEANGASADRITGQKNLLADYEGDLKSAKEQLTLQSTVDASWPNSEQRAALVSTHRERLLLENIEDAVKAGMKRMSFPTWETAARIQGHISGHTMTPDGWTRYTRGEKISLDDFKPKYKTILEKYNEESKMVEKLLGVKPKLEKDAAHNSVWGFDFPEKFLNNTAEIKALTTTGAALFAGKKMAEGQKKEKPDFSNGGAFLSTNMLKIY